MLKLAAASEIREFCESRDVREKFTASFVTTEWIVKTRPYRIIYSLTPLCAVAVVLIWLLNDWLINWFIIYGAALWNLDRHLRLAIIRAVLIFSAELCINFSCVTHTCVLSYILFAVSK